MARVPYVTDEALVEPARTLVLAHPINLYRALAHNPSGLECFAKTGDWIRYGSLLDARQREMVILTVGVLTHSPYEFSHHVKVGLDFGLVDEDIRDVISEAREMTSALDDRDRLVVRAAREVTLDGRISSPTWQALAETFDPPLLVELVLATAHYNAVVRVLASLEIDVESSYQGFLKDFPAEA
jgi:alkylhydroperoxidase family enzyme